MSEHPIEQLDHADPAVGAEIHAVMMAAYQVEADVLGVSEFPPLRRTATEITAADSTFIGSHAPSHLAAVAEIEHAQQDSITIAALVVHPSHFRQGLGRALVQHVIDVREGMRITVSTGARNVPALALYDCMGFDVARSWTTHDGVEMVELAREP